MKILSKSNLIYGLGLFLIGWAISATVISNRLSTELNYYTQKYQTQERLDLLRQQKAIHDKQASVEIGKSAKIEDQIEATKAKIVTQQNLRSQTQ